MTPMPSKTRLAGSGTALMPAAPEVCTVVRQHDGQVVDIHLAVAVEVPCAQLHAGLTVVRQHDRQIVDVNFAVAVSIAGQGAGVQQGEGVADAVQRSHIRRSPRSC